MKVKELIEVLQKQDPEKRIIVNGYEGGYEDIDEGSVVEVPIYLNKWEDSYMGPHEYRGPWDKEPEDEVAIAICR